MNGQVCSSVLLYFVRDCLGVLTSFESFQGDQELQRTSQQERSAYSQGG